MIYHNEIKANEIIVFANKNLYSKDSIFKCLYWYGKDFQTKVTLADNDTYRISIIPLSDKVNSIDELKTILVKLERDLIDFNLRDIVTKETQNIRDLLIAKAFSSGEFDELPVGELSDPVGFNVNDVK